MKENKKTSFLKKHRIALSCIAALLLCLGIFAVWYLHPRTYSDDMTVEAEDGETLSIHLELSAKQSFFKPEELRGSMFVNGEEYISTFYVENEDADKSYNLTSSFAELVSMTVPHDESRFFKNLKAKLQGEQWIPFFVLKGQESTQNVITVDNLSELFQANTSEECNLVVHKDGKSYTVK